MRFGVLRKAALDGGRGRRPVLLWGAAASVEGLGVGGVPAGEVSDEGGRGRGKGVERRGGERRERGRGGRERERHGRITKSGIDNWIRLTDK